MPSSVQVLEGSPLFYVAVIVLDTHHGYISVRTLVELYQGLTRHSNKLRLQLLHLRRFQLAAHRSCVNDPGRRCMSHFAYEERGSFTGTLSFHLPLELYSPLTPPLRGDARKIPAHIDGSVPGIVNPLTQATSP